jgi:DnaK suppressor protein
VTTGPDLERFRIVLESERDRLVHAAQAVHHEGSLLEETGDLAIGAGDHIADGATETYLRELDEGLEENAEHLLDEVDAALARLDAGTYGTCSKCGREIPEARLQAIPWASLCLDDKRALEGG